MDQLSPSLRSTDDWRRRRGAAIKQFLQEFAPSENEDLLEQMMITMSRLAADGADRGDLKILSQALRELRYAFKVFAPYADVNKVTIFGSSRTPPDHANYLQARKFAELIQSRGWMVITGAGAGIMHAGHHGATKESSFGVAISLPFEQETNAIIADDPKLIKFKYFFTRKLMFVKEARAIAVFPGGFGTQDEGFESVTLVQTIKAAPIPIVLCDAPGGHYWRDWQAFVESQLLGNGMIDPDDMSLFFITDRAEDAVNEILGFYRRFHSSRFVGEQLVMRLNSPVSDSLLAEINDAYSAILSEGRFAQIHGPLEGENGAYPDKPRLVFHFDCRSAGKLRLLINRINEAP